jgi:diacylglycerol O-acyltransferase
MAGMGDAMPPGATNWCMRHLGPAIASAGTIGNAVVSNVRGTPIPLYTAGARIEALYPMSLLAPSQGLNITVVSYMGRVDVGFTVDPELVPDPWSLAAGIPAALAELRSLAAARTREAA